MPIGFRLQGWRSERGWLVGWMQVAMSKQAGNIDLRGRNERDPSDDEVDGVVLGWRILTLTSRALLVRARVVGGSNGVGGGGGGGSGRCPRMRSTALFASERRAASGPGGKGVVDDAGVFS